MRSRSSSPHNSLCREAHAEDLCAPRRVDRSHLAYYLVTRHFDGVAPFTPLRTDAGTGHDLEREAIPSQFSPSEIDPCNAFHTAPFCI